MHAHHDDACMDKCVTFFLEQVWTYLYRVWQTTRWQELDHWNRNFHWSFPWTHLPATWSAICDNVLRSTFWGLHSMETEEKVMNVNEHKVQSPKWCVSVFPLFFDFHHKYCISTYTTSPRVHVSRPSGHTKSSNPTRHVHMCVIVERDSSPNEFYLQWKKLDGVDVFRFTPFANRSGPSAISLVVQGDIHWRATR